MVPYVEWDENSLFVSVMIFFANAKEAVFYDAAIETSVNSICQITNGIL